MELTRSILIEGVIHRQPSHDGTEWWLILSSDDESPSAPGAWGPTALAKPSSEP
jgi:hypothetical protein